MGRIAISAQAMINILEMVNGVAGMGIGIGLMTVVGQCIGAGRKEEAKYFSDWALRGLIFGLRFRSGKWLDKQVI